MPLWLALNVLESWNFPDPPCPVTCYPTLAFLQFSVLPLRSGACPKAPPHVPFCLLQGFSG